ncbi:hypothetical protein EVAR_50488_1 [Eumeta japonica]|uniref:Uncharacterized protein n=1 Tax=Eumeta variegata TaxID=151549 RepID=A0A4C1XUE9_EUMVA|nr:hypothetical protein EVAR_50488_1 [Eumeta japonica]
MDGEATSIGEDLPASRVCKANGRSRRPRLRSIRQASFTSLLRQVLPQSFYFDLEACASPLRRPSAGRGLLANIIPLMATSGPRRLNVPSEAGSMRLNLIKIKIVTSREVYEGVGGPRRPPRPTPAPCTLHEVGVLPSTTSHSNVGRRVLSSRHELPAMALLCAVAFMLSRSEGLSYENIKHSANSSRPRTGGCYTSGPLSAVDRARPG